MRALSVEEMLEVSGGCGRRPRSCGGRSWGKGWGWGKGSGKGCTPKPVVCPPEELPVEEPVDPVDPIDSVP